MSNFIQRDQQRRTLFAKQEKSRLKLQCIIKDLSLPVTIRSLFVRRLNNYSRNSSLIRVRNRCVLSGRGRGISRNFRVSRIKLRELGCQGHIAGLSKSSW